MRKLGYVVAYVPTAKVWHREGIDYQKNVGEYARSFTLIRNLLWVMHKHGEKYHWLTFLRFSWYYLPKMTLRFALRGDFRSSWAFVARFWLFGRCGRIRSIRCCRRGYKERISRPGLRDSSQASVEAEVRARGHKEYMRRVKAKSRCEEYMLKNRDE